MMGLSARIPIHTQMAQLSTHIAVQSNPVGQGVQTDSSGSAFSAHLLRLRPSVTGVSVCDPGFALVIAVHGCRDTSRRGRNISRVTDKLAGQ